MPVDSGYGGPERLTDGQEWPYHKLEGTGDWPTGGGGGGDPGGGVDPTPDAFLEVLATVLPGVLESYYGGGRRKRQMGVGAPAERVPIPAYRYGTSYHRGGPALVGEDGPEMAWLPRGTAVTPNPATRRRAAGRSSGVSITNPGGFSVTPNTAPGALGGQQERGGLRESDLDLGAGFGPDGQVSWPQLFQRLVQQGTKGGAFDPLGSQALARMARDAVSASGGARERAATLGADLDSGGDPSLRAVGRLNARLNTQSESSKAYLDAIMQSAMRNQAFMQALLGGPVAGAALRKDAPEPNPWAQAAGQVGGAVLGGWAGGAGLPAAPAGGMRPTPEWYGWA